VWGPPVGDLGGKVDCSLPIEVRRQSNRLHRPKNRPCRGSKSPRGEVICFGAVRTIRSETVFYNLHRPPDDVTELFRVNDCCPAQRKKGCMIGPTPLAGTDLQVHRLWKGVMVRGGIPQPRRVRDSLDQPALGDSLQIATLALLLVPALFIKFVHLVPLETGAFMERCKVPAVRDTSGHTPPSKQNFWRFLSDDRAVLHRTTAIGLKQGVKSVQEGNLIFVQQAG